jgi:hypothetical protein
LELRSNNNKDPETNCTSSMTRGVDAESVNHMRVHSGGVRKQTPWPMGEPNTITPASHCRNKSDQNGRIIRSFFSGPSTVDANDIFSSGGKHPMRLHLSMQ